MKKHIVINKLNRMIIVKSLLFIIISLSIASCKKFIEVPPPVTSVNEGNVYSDDYNAIAVVTTFYEKMEAAFTGGGFTGLSLQPELSADNLSLFDLSNQLYTQSYQNSLNPNSTSFWNTIYPLIYICNDAIAGISKSSTLTPGVKQRLLGEAYFLRAFSYFYLTNLYGDVPLALTPDYTQTSNLSRSPSADVYKQVLSDLKQATSLLDNKYVDGTLLAETPERIRPNKAAAFALLARTQLYLKDYSAAESAASSVISESALYSPTIPLDQVFLRNSSETIWALQSVKRNINTDEAALFILPITGPNNGNYKVYASDQLLKSFENGDQRKKVWIDSVKAGNKIYFFPSKYKVKAGVTTVTENSIVLRLSEQYLIRAEAEANGAGGGLNSAVSDLNIIRNRAGLANYSGLLSKQSVIDAIYHERQVELFTEWGHRWFDLKRNGTIDNVMSLVTPLKGGGSWQSYKALYPIPLTDILVNKSLTQNIGYN